MSIVHTIAQLWRADARSVARDPMLRWLLLVPLVVALALRLALPGVAARAGALIAIDLAAHVALVARYVAILIAPALAGMVAGFLLLDLRDDRTLTALRLTPLAPGLFLGSRLAAPMLAGGLVSVLAALVAGAALPAGQLALAALASAPVAPALALTLGALAENKVQGLAITKGLGAALIAPLAALALPEAWQPLLWLLPTYWPARLIWLDPGDPSILATFAIALGYQSLVVAGLAWAYARPGRLH